MKRKMKINIEMSKYLKMESHVALLSNSCNVANNNIQRLYSNITMHDSQFHKKV